MRTSRKLAVCAVLAAVGLAACPAAAAETLTYTDLVARLTDLEHLAVLPQPGEKCMQWSSWDRASKYDAKADKYVRWDANGDGDGYIRKEGDALVLAEMEGPGCIWRIWSAMPQKGHVKVFLDGQEKPAIDLPFEQYFNCTVKPFVYPSLCYDAARGKNCYVPIPFAKSCKIVADKDWGRYFHFTYGLFPEGTQVPTFKMDLSDEEAVALKAVDDRLSKRMGVNPALMDKPNVEPPPMRRFTIAPGKAECVFQLKGPQAVTTLKALVKCKDRAEEMDALREMALRITWDDDDSPAVWCPLGDFFGTAPGVNLYRSLPMGMMAGGFYSYWYMPFAKGAKIEVANDGKAAREVEMFVATAPLKRPIEQLGRFHAKWHRDAFLPDRKDRYPDWTMLTTTGRGRFVGVMLHIWNPKGGQYPPAGEGRYWWGEGDEKFFVDGEKFPSTFGTGSEDYFGYAWGNPSLFARAYHNQTISSGNRGHISVNRWHVTDNVPFQTSFEGAIEKYFPNDWPTRYACVAYWYLAPGGKDPHGEVPMAERLGWYEQPKAKVSRVQGALDYVLLKPAQ